MASAASPVSCWRAPAWVQLAALDGPGTVALDDADVEGRAPWPDRAAPPGRARGRAATAPARSRCAPARCGSPATPWSSNDNHGGSAPRGRIEIAADRLVLREHGGDPQHRARGPAMPHRSRSRPTASRSWAAAPRRSPASPPRPPRRRAAMAARSPCSPIAWSWQGGDAQINADAFGAGDAGPILVSGPAASRSAATAAIRRPPSRARRSASGSGRWAGDPRRLRHAAADQRRPHPGADLRPRRGRHDRRLDARADHARRRPTRPAQRHRQLDPRPGRRRRHPPARRHPADRAGRPRRHRRRPAGRRQHRYRGPIA